MIPMFSEACAELTRESEGLSLTVYGDPAPGSFQTIGYGHKLLPGESYASITPQMAEAMLQADLRQAWMELDIITSAVLTQGQVDALTDFVFNVGMGAPGVKSGYHWLYAGGTSTLYHKVETNNPSAADEFSKWVYAGDTVLPGLVTRRAAERALFVS